MSHKCRLLIFDPPKRSHSIPFILNICIHFKISFAWQKSYHLFRSLPSTRFTQILFGRAPPAWNRIAVGGNGTSSRRYLAVCMWFYFKQLLSFLPHYKSPLWFTILNTIPVTEDELESKTSLWLIYTKLSPQAVEEWRPKAVLGFYWLYK